MHLVAHGFETLSRDSLLHPSLHTHFSCHTLNFPKSKFQTFPAAAHSQDLSCFGKQKGPKGKQLGRSHSAKRPYTGSASSVEMSLTKHYTGVDFCVNKTDPHPHLSHSLICYLFKDSFRICWQHSEVSIIWYLIIFAGGEFLKHTDTLAELCPECFVALGALMNQTHSSSFCSTLLLSWILQPTRAGLSC